MNEAAKYRANAELCRRMADKAQNEQDRRAWLEMAQSWSFLTKLEHVVPSEEFDALGTNDPDQFGRIVYGIRKRCSAISLTLIDSLRTMLDATLASISSRLK